MENIDDKVCDRCFGYGDGCNCLSNGGLLPCPFCRSEDVKEIPVFDGWNQEVGSHIKCNGCNIQTADYPFDGAKLLWNKRAKPDYSHGIKDLSHEIDFEDDLK